MLLKRLTPDTQLRLHIAKAREFWRLDQLESAAEAMRQALRVGVPPGPLYDFQRMLEAELGARESGSIFRVGENLCIEADPRVWGGYWPVIIRTTVESVQRVESVLDVRWAKPVLLTLIPIGEWVAFMRARYGYYAARTDSHKVCLPPGAVTTASQLRRATLHEITHAAVQQLAGTDVPRWLDEGLAVVMEGETPSRPDLRRLRLDDISGGFENWDVELGSPRAHLSYAGAGDFMARMVDRVGWWGISSLLQSVRNGLRIEKAIKQTIGTSLRDLERDWMSGGTFRGG